MDGKAHFDDVDADALGALTRSIIVKKLQGDKQEEHGDEGVDTDTDSDGSVQFVSFISSTSTKQLKRPREEEAVEEEAGGTKAARTAGAVADTSLLFGGATPPSSGSSEGGISSIRARMQALHRSRTASEKKNAAIKQAVKAARAEVLAPPPAPKPAVASAAGGGGEAPAKPSVLQVGWRPAAGSEGKLETVFTLVSISKPLRKLWKRVVKAQGGEAALAGCKLTYDGVAVGKKDTLLMMDPTLQEEATSASQRADAGEVPEADCWVTVHIGVPNDQ